MKKIISVIICVILLIPTFSSCSRKPELSALLPRLEELINEAEEVNEILFGEGLPVYEHIEDPMNNLIFHTEKTTDENGKEIEISYYYYVVPDSRYEYKIIAFRKSEAPTSSYTYVRVVNEPEEKGVLVYKHEKTKIYAYLLEGYIEPEYEYFYTEEDPEDYDYVRAESKYQSISAIKEAAEVVYSKDYLDSLYESLFDGTVVQAGTTLTSNTARYMEYSDEDGSISLMQSNKYEPLVTEKRIYDLSTASIVRPKNGKFVTIELESYLESKPDERLTVRLTMVLQDGEWYLDSGTY